MPGNAPALEKGLKVIELVLAAGGPLTLSRIAEALGYKVSEIQRMVEYLAAERYLARIEGGAYVPGHRAYGIANGSRDAYLASRAEGPMRRFARAISVSIHVGVLVDEMLHVLYGIEGGAMVRVGVAPGLYEARDTVSGRLLLAYRGEVEAESAAIRERGWNFGQVACARGVFIVAVPLAIGDEACAAVLASSYLMANDDPPAARMDLIAALTATAKEIGALC
ncbi:MAG: helix-turn-helix domain-containing protein [Spirochaetaceae bacterium]|nr:helix-turn-helix domain-containing protein [Spirochaetaceae bacterium]